MFRSTTFHFFYFCGDLNFLPLCSMPETACNMVLGMTGLLIISKFGGGTLM